MKKFSVERSTDLSLNKLHTKDVLKSSNEKHIHQLSTECTASKESLQFSDKEDERLSFESFNDTSKLDPVKEDESSFESKIINKDALSQLTYKIQNLKKQLSSKKTVKISNQPIYHHAKGKEAFVDTSEYQLSSIQDTLQNFKDGQRRPWSEREEQQSSTDQYASMSTTDSQVVKKLNQSSIPSSRLSQIIEISSSFETCNQSKDEDVESQESKETKVKPMRKKLFPKKIKDLSPRRAQEIQRSLIQPMKKFLLNSAQTNMIKFDMYNDFEVGLSFSKMAKDERPKDKLDIQQFYIEQTMDDDLKTDNGIRTNAIASCTQDIKDAIKEIKKFRTLHMILNNTEINSRVRFPYVYGRDAKVKKSYIMGLGGKTDQSDEVLEMREMFLQYGRTGVFTNARKHRFGRLRSISFTRFENKRTRTDVSDLYGQESSSSQNSYNFGPAENENYLNQFSDEI